MSPGASRAAQSRREVCLSATVIPGRVSSSGLAAVSDPPAAHEDSSTFRTRSDSHLRDGILKDADAVAQTTMAGTNVRLQVKGQQWVGDPLTPAEAQKCRSSSPVPVPHSSWFPPTGMSSRKEQQKKITSMTRRLFEAIWFISNSLNQTKGPESSLPLISVV